MKKLPPRLLYLIVAALLAFATSCSTFGVATESYVEERVDAVDEARVETAAAIVAPLEPIAPGITEYARKTAEGVRVAPPPPPDPTEPWMPLISLALTALGIPASVKLTNHIRDKSRRARHEATSVEEALAKGYHLDGAKPTAG